MELRATQPSAMSWGLCHRSAPSRPLPAPPVRAHVNASVLDWIEQTKRCGGAPCLGPSLRGRASGFPAGSVPKTCPRRYASPAHKPGRDRRKTRRCCSTENITHMGEERGVVFAYAVTPRLGPRQQGRLPLPGTGPGRATEGKPWFSLVVTLVFQAPRLNRIWGIQAPRAPS